MTDAQARQIHWRTFDFPLRKRQAELELALRLEGLYGISYRD